MSSSPLEWRRVERPDGPPTYFNDSHAYAIFPEFGGRGWELCTVAEADGGYSLLEFFDTVKEAKAEAERLAGLRS